MGFCGDDLNFSDFINICCLFVERYIIDVFWCSVVLLRKRKIIWNDCIVEIFVGYELLC